MKRTKPNKIELKLTKETIRVVPNDQLPDVAGGGSRRQCTVAPWCAAHTC